MLLGSLYQEFYRNQSVLAREQEELILLYANNTLEYAEKLKDTTIYIKFFIHSSFFASILSTEGKCSDWNGKLTEIWTLLTQTPQNFKGSDI